MFRTCGFASSIAFLACSATANDRVDLHALFDEAEQIVKAVSVVVPLYQAEVGSPLRAAPPLTVAPGLEEQAQSAENCGLSLNDIRAELEGLSVKIAAKKVSLLKIGEAYQTASVVVPRGNITQCTDALAEPLDALIADIAAIEFGPLRASVKQLTGCVVQREAEINNQNEAYTNDQDSLSSRDALLLGAKLKLVSEVSAEYIELSHEVERLDSKRGRMADAISETRSFCVEDY